MSWYWSCATVALWSVMLCSGALTAPQKYNLAQCLPLRTGDTWQWGTSKEGKIVPHLTTVVKGKQQAEGISVVVREWSDGEVEHFRRTDNGVEWYGGKVKSKIGPVPWHLKDPILFPCEIAVGEQRVQTCAGTLGPRLPLPKLNRTLKFTLRLDAVEDVTVPAGHFPQCLKVTMTFDAGSVFGTDTRLTRTAWYAKGLGEVKIENTEHGSSPRVHPLLRATIGGKEYPAP